MNWFKIITDPTKTTSKITILQTVYPPISNQEAIWLKDDAEVEAIFRLSDFYMIAGRAEARFLDITFDSVNEALNFQFVIAESFCDFVTINIRELPLVANSNIETFYVETGEKLIRIWDGPIGNSESSVLEWFTTEKLIWDRSRGYRGIKFFEFYSEAATYDLLYVGIAKVGDSFERLIANGHKARMDILGNEPQRYPGARVTDEIYLFLFEAQPLIMQTFTAEHDFENEDFSGNYEHKRIVADAEKAFVSLLKPEYNVQKFKNYPKSADGLYKSEYERYGYSICEAVSFNTAHGCFSGSRDPITEMITNDGDFIFVEGSEVKFYISGEDFSKKSK